MNTEHVRLLHTSLHSWTVRSVRRGAGTSLCDVLLPPSTRLVLRQTSSSSAGQQARRIVDKTAELVRQVFVVFRQEVAHFCIQKIFGQILHDGSCRPQDTKIRGQRDTQNVSAAYYFPLKCRFNTSDISLKPLRVDKHERLETRCSLRRDRLIYLQIWWNLTT